MFFVAGSRGQRQQGFLNKDQADEVKASDYLMAVCIGRKQVLPS